MNKNDESWPIQNLFSGEPERLQRWVDEAASIYMAAHRQGVDSLDLHRKKLGKHHHTMNLWGERLYIWEFERHRIYVGRRKGFVFEVADDMGIDEAEKLWSEHRATMTS